MGLSCALRLAQKQFQVSIFDKNEGWGGALRKHPRFPEFDREFRMHFLSVTVSTCYNQIIDNLDALSDFDAVFVATGREGSHFGLLASLHPKLHSTSNPRVFLGGEVTGVSMITGMGDTIAASRAMEAFLLSGSPTFASETWDSGNALRYAPHDGEPQKPAVLTEDVELTEETAQREAERCMQCDCVACMHACELLVKGGFKTFMDNMAEKGYTSIIGGVDYGGRQFEYLDLQKELGFIVELYNDPPDFKPLPGKMYPPQE